MGASKVLKIFIEKIWEERYCGKEIEITIKQKGTRT